MPEYLTVTEVANLLRVSDQTVWDRIREGLIPAVKEGRRYLIRATDLEAYLGRRSSPDPGEARA